MCWLFRIISLSWWRIPLLRWQMYSRKPTLRQIQSMRERRRRARLSRFVGNRTGASDHNFSTTTRSAGRFETHFKPIEFYSEFCIRYWIDSNARFTHVPEKKFALTIRTVVMESANVLMATMNCIAHVRMRRMQNSNQIYLTLNTNFQRAKYNASRMNSNVPTATNVCHRIAFVIASWTAKMEAMKPIVVSTILSHAPNSETLRRILLKTPISNCTIFVSLLFPTIASLWRTWWCMSTRKLCNCCFDTAVQLSLLLNAFTAFLHQNMRKNKT